MSLSLSAPVLQKARDPVEGNIMKIPRQNFAHQIEKDEWRVLEEIAAAIRSGQAILSEHVSDFEEDFARYLSVAHVVGVNSGTDALVLALRALGVGPGDEVVTQANTFHATVAAICLVGATPILVDPHPETFLMMADAAVGAFSSRTKAVIPVHLFGKPTPLIELIEAAEARGIYVVEDSAQSHGASRDGAKTGTLGIFGCFSFHPSKNLAASGDAGAICTNDGDLAQKLRMLRHLGQPQTHSHILLGCNSRLDAIQAIILRAKLRHLDAWNRARSSVAARYRTALSGCPITFQALDADETHVFHLLQIRTDRRDQLYQYLRQRGIDAKICYPTPVHRQPAFSHLDWPQDAFPVSSALAAELLCLPIRPDMTPGEVDFVSQAVREFL